MPQASDIRLTRRTLSVLVVLALCTVPLPASASPSQAVTVPGGTRLTEPGSSACSTPSSTSEAW